MNDGLGPLRPGAEPPPPAHARIVECEPGDGGCVKGFAIEFLGPKGWTLYPVSQFATWVGAAGWLAAQGIGLQD